MKTKVVIDQDIIKRYYLDLFIVTIVPLIVLIFIVGNIGFIYFLIKGDLVFSISMEAFTIIFIILLFIMNRNNLKIALNEFHSKNNEYEVEFKDNQMLITTDKSNLDFNFNIIKIKKLIRFIMFKVYDESGRLIYIVPKSSFSKEEWISLTQKIKEEWRKK